MAIFCRDFRLSIPKSKIGEVYTKVSTNRQSLNHDQFKQALPHLGLEYAKAKTVELQCRLREMKHVMEYPKNKKDVKLAKNIYEVLKRSETYMERKQENQTMIPEFVLLEDR